MTRKIGPVLFLDTVNLERHIGQILMPFVGNVSDEVKEYGFFQQTVQLPIQPVIQMLSSITFLGNK